MLRYKGMIDTLVLVLIAAALLGAFFIFIEINKYVSIIEIKGEVDVYLDLEDRGTHILSFLRSKKSDMNYMGILGSYTAGEVPTELENEITSTLRQLGDYHVIVQDPKGIIKEFKSIKPPTGGTYLKEQISLDWPVKNYETIEDGYGWRMLEGRKDFHGGVDFAVLEGTEVYSAYPKGRVVKIGKNCEPSPDVCKDVYTCKTGGEDPYCCCHEGLGNHIVIEHVTASETFYTHYDHLSEVYVGVDYVIGQGKDIHPSQPIGKTGKTGFVKGVTGEHLHFELSKSEIKSDENSIDPCPYFPLPVPPECEQESHRSPSLSVSIPLPNGQIGIVGLII